MSNYPRLKFLWIWLLLATPLCSLIIEIPHFKEICTHVTPDTLILLDIDDTLIETQQMLGSSPWFEQRCKKYRDEGFSSSVALEKSLAEWKAVTQLTKMKLVESGTEEIIRQFQMDGYYVMGLTARGLGLVSRTRLQLAEHLIDLSVCCPSKEDFYTCVKDQGVLYRYGILYTSGRCKGESLFKICEQMGYTPKKIVFVDDKLSHLQDVESFAKMRGIEFIGLRYNYSDAHKAAYRPEIADIEWHHSTFGKILSDAEATSIHIQ